MTADGRATSLPGVDGGGVWDQERWVPSGHGMMGASVKSKGRLRGSLERWGSGCGPGAGGLPMASDFNFPRRGFLKAPYLRRSGGIEGDNEYNV